jgi:hypothetical protein
MKVTDPIDAVGWIGAGTMVVASFNMASSAGLITAIVGLALLTIQAAHNRTMNLVLLNISSIIGFTYALYI